MSESIEPNVRHSIDMRSSVPSQEHQVALVLGQTGVGNAVKGVTEHAALERVLPRASWNDALMNGSLLCCDASKSADLLTEAIVPKRIHAAVRVKTSKLPLDEVAVVLGLPKRRTELNVGRTRRAVR